MRIIAYTYDADVHCPECARERFGRHILPQWRQDEQPDLVDSAIDSEGNPVRPVYDIDEDPDGSFTHCGDCHEELT